MKKKIILVAALTFVLTSIVWFLITRNIVTKSEEECNYIEDEVVDIHFADSLSTVRAELIGEWEPVELSQSRLLFTQYKTLVVTPINGSSSSITYSYFFDDYPYINEDKTDADVVRISNDAIESASGNSFRYLIQKEANDTYLLIYSHSILSGKYKKVK